MWVATADLPTSAGHPFYERLNRMLDDAGFDAFVEAQCAPFYADDIVAALGFLDSGLTVFALRCRVQPDEVTSHLGAGSR